MTNNQVVTDALANLYRLVECVCGDDWTGRGLHETQCRSEYSSDVKIIEDTLRRCGVIRELIRYDHANLEVMYYGSPLDTVIDGPSGVLIKHLPSGVWAKCHQYRKRLQNQVHVLQEINSQLEEIGWVDNP